MLCFCDHVNWLFEPIYIANIQAMLLWSWHPLLCQNSMQILWSCTPYDFSQYDDVLTDPMLFVPALVQAWLISNQSSYASNWWIPYLISNQSYLISNQSWLTAFVSLDYKTVPNYHIRQKVMHCSKLTQEQIVIAHCPKGMYISWNGQAFISQQLLLLQNRKSTLEGYFQDAFIYAKCLSFRHYTTRMLYELMWNHYISVICKMTYSKMKYD